MSAFTLPEAGAKKRLTSLIKPDSPWADWQHQSGGIPLGGFAYCRVKDTHPVQVAWWRRVTPNMMQLVGYDVPANRI